MMNILALLLEHEFADTIYSTIRLITFQAIKIQDMLEERYDTYVVIIGTGYV